ncbi:endonuclease III domain-containing protein, partial [bacterium]|nr:endonuclease III domain-containing protein [bacterium]
LLDIRGIGPETADSILLYALGRPVFVVDAYTRRLAARHGWVEPRVSYGDLAAFFTDRLPTDVSLFNQFHALIVRLAKEHCCKRNPRCHPCPLAGLQSFSSIRRRNRWFIS